jgi:peptide/nickel transport system permease protein
MNGSGSFGFEGTENLNFTWFIRQRAVNFTMYGMVVEFSFPNVGLVEINLTVRDSLNRTAWDNAYVFVNPEEPSFLSKYWFDIFVLAIVGAIAAYVLIDVIRRLRTPGPFFTESEKEKTRLRVGRFMKVTSQVMHNRMGAIGVVVLIFFGVMAIVGPMISGDVKSIVPGREMQPPSNEHPLGTDNFGIDILSQLLYGARTSMIVGVVSAIIASVLGAAVGLYSGYAGGWKDEVVMRLNDIVLSIPWLVLMIIIAALWGKIDLTGIILIIGLTGWSYTARMVRAQVLSVKERQYIERARALGASDMNIITKHIFPNTFPLIFANTILTVAVSILSEATLSFLGMRPVGEVTWGTMLSYAESNSAFQNDLHGWILLPGLCIVAVVLGFTLLGYALDEILNPKLRHR